MATIIHANHQNTAPVIASDPIPGSTPDALILAYLALQGTLNANLQTSLEQTKSMQATQNAIDKVNSALGSVPFVQATPNTKKVHYPVLDLNGEVVMLTGTIKQRSTWAEKEYVTGVQEANEESNKQMTYLQNNLMNMQQTGSTEQTMLGNTANQIGQAINTAGNLIQLLTALSNLARNLSQRN